MGMGAGPKKRSLSIEEVPVLADDAGGRKKMKVEELRAHAKHLGLPHEELKKTELLEEIESYLELQQKPGAGAPATAAEAGQGQATETTPSEPPKGPEPPPAAPPVDDSTVPIKIVGTGLAPDATEAGGGEAFGAAEVEEGEAIEAGEGEAPGGSAEEPPLATQA